MSARVVVVWQLMHICRMITQIFILSIPPEHGAELFYYWMQDSNPKLSILPPDFFILRKRMRK
jgi:hypothetical protein